MFRPRISEAAISAATDVMRSGWLGLGPVTAEFEQAFARYIGIEHCVGLNSCTSAIHLALHILDLPPGSEVITTPVTFVSTNHAILHEGLTPVFADVDPGTGIIDPASIAARITSRTRAIIVVHYGGCPAPLDEIYALADSCGATVIEDCAHACGAMYKGSRVGSRGVLHAFSFHAVKNLPMGDGGALTVRSESSRDRLRRLRWLGIDRDTYRRTKTSGYEWDYEVTEVGFKYHMNDIQAAIGLAQLTRLDEENERRKAIADLYRESLAGVAAIGLPPELQDRCSSNHLFPVLVEKRNRVAERMRAEGIGVGVHYRRNDEYPMYEKTELPGAELFTTRVMSLPMHLDLSDEDALSVARELVRAVER